MHAYRGWIVALVALTVGCGSMKEVRRESTAPAAYEGVARDAEAPAELGERELVSSEAMVSAAPGGRERVALNQPTMAPGGPPAAPSPVAPSPTAKGPAAPPPSVADAPHSGALLIYTASLAMAVFQVEPSMNAVEQVGRGMGGYLAARQDGAITIRVPRDRFDDALARIDRLGDVTHRDIKAQDVTDEFVDVEARLKNARAMRDRLQALLGRAEVKEALDIERELGRITEDIERFEGRLKLLRDEIAFSTITVTFSPVAEQSIHDTSLLSAFPWMQNLGLPTLLGVQR